MKLSKADREKIRMMFGGKCAYCGEELKSGWCADHVEPIYRTMTYARDPITGHSKMVPTGKCDWPERDTRDNLFPSCRACNIHKGPYMLETWRSNLQDLLGVLRRGYPTYRHAVRFGQVRETAGPIVFWFEQYDAQNNALTRQ